MDVTIPDLPPGTAPISASPFESVEGGTSVRYTLAQIAALITGGGAGPWLPITGGTLTGPFDIQFVAGPPPTFKVGADGKVGIGNAAPIQLLDMERDSNNSIGIAIRNHDGGASANTILQFDNGSSSGGIVYTGAGQLPANEIFVQSGGGIRFQTGGFSERARITAQGYFKAAYNGSYPVGAYNIHEFTAGESGRDAMRVMHDHASTPSGMMVQFLNAAPNDAGNYFLRNHDSAADRSVLAANGGLQNYSANNANISDAELKTDITPYTDADLDALEESFKAVDWCRFKYADQTHTDWNHGYTAQGVEVAFIADAPELVDDADLGPLAEDGTPQKHKAVYDTDLTHIGMALLARALKRIADLEARLTAAGV